MEDEKLDSGTFSRLLAILVRPPQVSPILLVLIVFSLFVFSSISKGAEIYPSIAASMTDVFKEIIKDFSAAYPDAQPRPNFGSSGSLAKQIDQGAPADIYVSANPKWMKYLVEKGLIAPGTDRIFGFNKLVFIGEKEPDNPSLEGLVSLKRIGLGSPGSVPAGQYAKQAMERAGVYSMLARKKKLVMAKDVRQALLHADRGEVDGAFVYKTDALLATHAKILFIVPDDLHDRISYHLALTVSGAKKDEAKAFYNFMASSEATTILSRYGFEPNQ